MRDIDVRALHLIHVYSAAIMMLSAVRAVASAGLLTGAARATLPAALRLRYSAGDMQT